MGLPHKLKNFTVFADGINHLGQVSEVELPKLAIKAEGFRTGGMLSELDADMGLEKMEATVKYGGAVRSLLRQFGRVGVSGAMLRFVGAYQEEQVGGVLPAELVMIGKIMEVDAGTAKVGDNTEWAGKMTLSYLKWSIVGRTEVEIDVIAGVFMVDGIDRYAEIRAAMGL